MANADPRRGQCARKKNDGDVADFEAAAALLGARNGGLECDIRRDTDGRARIAHVGKIGDAEQGR